MLLHTATQLAQFDILTIDNMLCDEFDITETAHACCTPDLAGYSQISGTVGD